MKMKVGTVFEARYKNNQRYIYTYAGKMPNGLHMLWNRNPSLDIDVEDDWFNVRSIKILKEVDHAAL